MSNPEVTARIVNIWPVEPPQPEAMPPRFQVDVEFTILDPVTELANIVDCKVVVPFDWNATYASIRTEAIRIAQDQAGLIRDSQQKRSSPPAK